MICTHNERKNILEAKDFFLFKCFLCELIFLVKKNNTENNPTVYKNYYKKETGGRFGKPVELIVKSFRFLRALKIFFLQPKNKKILDIGSGRGWTLYFLKKYFKYKGAVGTQISENAYRFSKEKLGLEIYKDDLLNLDFNEKKFGIISLWHVLEHIQNPEAYIQKIYATLDDEGLLLIEVPNFNAWSRIISGKYWLSLDPKHHVIFFTPRSLKNLLKKYSFKIEKIKYFSLEYSVFTSTQSIVNLLTKTDNYFFEWLQEKRFNFKIIFHIFLFAIIFPLSLFFNLVLYFSERGEVINIVAEKNEK